MQHHERLIRELYLLQQDRADQDQFSNFMEVASDPIDQEKLNAYVNEHKLRYAPIYIYLCVRVCINRRLTSIFPLLDW